MVEKRDGLGYRFGWARRKLPRNTWADARPSTAEEEAAQESSPEELIRRLRRRLWVERCLFSSVLTVLVGAWVYPLIYPCAWAVYVDGRPVLSLRTRDAAQAVLSRLLDRAWGSSAALPRPVRLGSVAPGEVEVVDPAGAGQKLSTLLDAGARRTIVYVNDRPVVALPDRAQAEEVLKRIKGDFASRLEKLDADPFFKEWVDLRSGQAPEELWADADTAVSLLRGADGPADSTHVVAAGETATKIAHRQGLSLERLKELNPGVELEQLSAGQQLCLGTGAPPLLTVITEGQTSAIEAIPFREEAIGTNRMRKGAWSLRQAGQAGKRRIVYHVRCENGKAVSCKETSHELVREPRPKIELYGMAPVAATPQPELEVR